MTKYSIELNNVTKQYGEFVAVDSLSFNVPTGCVYGLLGPNGAGKTTTLRMINDIVLPDCGTITLLGELPPGPGAAQNIGYLPEERGLYPKMKVAETLRFFGELRGLDRRSAQRQTGVWLERLKIADWHGNKVQDLSKGMQQKVQFAAALIHDPDLLILDEPWSGLDPINAEVLKDVVLAQKEAGHTIVFSTHQMEQAEKICDRVCIMARGRKAVEGSLSDLKAESAPAGIVMLEFTDAEASQLAHEGVLSSPTILHCRTKNDTTEVQLVPEGRPEALLQALVQAGVGIRRFEHKQPSLHQIFVDKVGAQSGTAVAGRVAGEAQV